MPMMKLPVRSSAVRLSTGIAAALLASLLSGCALTTAVTPLDTRNVVFGGNVHGGNQPVSFSHIALFATTAAGYGGTLTPLATATSLGDGTFSITSSYICPANSQAYIAAAGGNPGLPNGTDNSALVMMAALGPCTGVSTATNVTINEVTTIAAAYALSGFAPANNSITEGAIVTGTNVPGFTTSATNLQGITDAFANANNIVNFANGTAYSTTPNSSANGTVPTSVINALADILQDCVNSAGPTSANCVSLFTAATPPAGSGVSAPVNTLQAALDIARYPANNVTSLYNLISAQSAFNSSSLTAAPNDWTIGIAYTNSLLASGLGMAIDANDNVYVSGSTNASLLEFNPQGNVLSPGIISPATTGGWLPTIKTSSHNIRNIAIDQSNNLWLSDGAAAGLYQYVPGASTATQMLYSAAPASVTTANNYNVAVDNLGDVWTMGYKKSTCTTSGTTACEVVEYVKNGSAYSPNAVFSPGSISAFSAGVGGARGLAFDVNTGNLWYTDIVENAASLFQTTPASGSAATVTAAPTNFTLGTAASSPTTNTYGAVSVSVDNTSRAWVVVAGGPATTGATATSAVPAGLYPISKTGSAQTPVFGGGLLAPAYTAIDGNNNIFIANTGATTAGSPGATTNAGTIVEYSPGFNSNAGAFLSGTYGFSPSATNTGNGINGLIFQPGYVAVDRSGAIWTFSPGSGTPTVVSNVVTNLQTANLVQILGVAAPTNPVLSAGQYGVKP